MNLCGLCGGWGGPLGCFHRFSGRGPPEARRRPDVGHQRPLKGPRGPLKGPRDPFQGPRGPLSGPRGPFKGGGSQTLPPRVDGDPMVV